MRRPEALDRHAGVLRERSGNRRGRGGAGTVVAGFAILAASNSVGFYGLAVYLGSLEARGNFSLALVSSLTSVFFLVSGFTSLGVGRVLPRLGVRNSALIGALACGGGVWLVGHSATSWQLLGAYILLGASMALTGPIVLTTALLDAESSVARRNQAMAVMLSGMTAGGALVVPVLAGSVERYGLEATTAIAAPLALLGVALPALTLGRGGRRGDAPAAAGRPGPAPGPAASPGGLDAPEVAAEQGLIGWGSKRATATFVLVCVTFAMFLGVQVGFNTQLYTIASEFGIAGAGAALGIVAGVGLVARIIGIVLVRWVSPERFLAAMALAQAAAAATLLLVQERAGLYAAAALLGLAVGNASVLSPILTLRLFGREHYSRLLGRLSFVMTLGIASGPAISGAVRSAAGDYAPVLIGVSAASLLAMILCLALGRVCARDPGR